MLVSRGALVPGLEPVAGFTSRLKHSGNQRSRLNGFEGAHFQPLLLLVMS